MDKDLRPTGLWLALAALRFAAEIGMLAGLAYVGLRVAGSSLALGIVLALVLVGLAAAVWGRWVAPRAPHRLGDPGRFAVEVALFGGTVVALALVAPSRAAAVAAALLAVAYAVSAPVGRKGW